MGRFVKEQRYTTWQLTRKGVDVRLLQDHFKGFYSYKNDCRKNGVPDDARVVAFHGRPRPRFCNEQWVQDVLKDRSVPEHGWVSLAEGIAN